MHEYLGFVKMDCSAEELEQVKSEIEEFRLKIPGIVLLTVGINTREEEEFNLGAHIRFESAAARKAYGSDPVHKSVLDRWRDRIKAASFVEYQIDD